MDWKMMMMGWLESVLHYMPKFFLAMAILLAALILGKYLRRLTYAFYHRIFKTQPKVAVVISTAFYILAIVIGVFLALEALGLESFLGKLLASAGILGVIAGFAFKDIASNTFSGILVKVQQPFEPGDWVVINGNYGRIEEIGFITTQVKNVEGQLVYIPNHIIYANPFINYSHYRKRRISVTWGVSYGDDLDFVREVARDEIAKIPELLLEEGVQVFFTEIASSTYQFEVRFWIQFNDNVEFMHVRSESIVRLKKRFEQEGISVAYNVLSLDFGVKGGVNIDERIIQHKMLK